MASRRMGSIPGTKGWTGKNVFIAPEHDGSLCRYNLDCIFSEMFYGNNKSEIPFGRVPTGLI